MGSIHEFSVSMGALNGRPRTIRVFVPEPRPGQDRFPVLYMHDGQNLFDDATAAYGTCWGIRDHLDASGLGLIVVGVDNGEGQTRLDEYSPWPNPCLKYQGYGFVTRTVGGEGRAYGDFLVKELKPLVDRNFPTLADRDHTAVAGSSMGGLISLYLGLARPDIFGRVAAFSSALWFAQTELVTLIESSSTGPDWIYMDTGTAESSGGKDMNQVYLQSNRTVVEALRSRFGGDRVHYLEEEGGEHNEAAWRRRIAPLLPELAGI